MNCVYCPTAFGWGRFLETTTRKNSAKTSLDRLSEEMRALGIRHEQAMKRIDAAIEAILSVNEQAKRGLGEQEKTLLDRLDVRSLGGSHA